MAGVTGGNKLKAFFKKAAAAQARRVKGGEVGFFGKQAQTAALNEFGTSKQPERPFFRHAIQGAGDVLLGIVKKGVDVRTMVIDDALADRVGEAMKGRIQDSIEQLKSPPNAPATISRKGSADPLIDEGDLLNSVDFKVQK